MEPIEIEHFSKNALDPGSADYIHKGTRKQESMCRMMSGISDRQIASVLYVTTLIVACTRLQKAKTHLKQSLFYSLTFCDLLIHFEFSNLLSEVTRHKLH